MCDHVALSRQVEEVLLKSKKSLIDIRRALSNRKYNNKIFGLESAHSMNSDQLISQVPPIWDNDLMTIYTKNLVETFISQPPQQLSYTARTTEKTLRKDESVMVNEIDFEKMQNDKVLHEETDIRNLKAEWKPIKKVQSNSSVKNKFPITPRSTRTARLRAELNRKDGKKLKLIPSQVKKVHSPKKPTTVREKINTSQFYRFLGGRNWYEQKFFKENPNLSIVYDNSETLFPKRAYKLSNEKEKELYLIDEKENIKTEKIAKHILDKSAIHKSEKLPLHYVHDNKPSRAINYDIILEKNHIDSVKSSTWHEVLLERNQKAKIYRYSGQQPTTKEGDDLKEKEYYKKTEEDKPKESFKKSSNQYNYKKIIDFGTDILEIKEQMPKNLSNLSVKNLPVLYIKSECQIQQSVLVDIQPRSENDENLNENSEPVIKNIKFEEFIHGAEELKENMNNTVALETKISDTVEQNIREPINDNVQIDKELEIKVNKNKTNKYLLPFINSESENVAQETDYNSDSYETISSSSTIKMESLNSSQTDDQKLKSISKITSPVYDSHPEVPEEESGNITISNSDEVLNMLEEVFFAAIKKFDELPELKITDSESISESEPEKLEKIKTTLEPQISNTNNIAFEKENIVQKSLKTPKETNATQNTIISNSQKVFSKILEPQATNLEKQLSNYDNEIKSRILLSQNIPKDNYIDQVFEKIYLDEPEGVKTFKNETINRINAKREIFGFSGLNVKQDVSKQKSLVLKDKKDDIPSSSEKINEIKDDQNRFIRNKVETVSVGCNTNEELPQKQTDFDTINKNNIKNIKQDSPHQTEELSLTSSSSKILKNLTTQNSYKSLKDNVSFSPTSLTTESSYSCCPICSGKQHQKSNNVNHQCNILDSEFDYSPVSVPDIFKSLFNLKENKCTSTSNAKIFDSSCESPISCKSNGNSLTKTHHKPKSRCKIESLSSSGNSSSQDCPKQQFNSEKKRDYFFKSKSDIDRNICTNIDSNVKKPYDPEVKRAVRKFLNSLEMPNQTFTLTSLVESKNYPKTSKISKNLADCDFNLTLSDILLTSTSLSSDSSSKVSVLSKENKITDKKEKLDSPILFKRSSTFIIDDNESMIENSQENISAKTEENIKSEEKAFDKGEHSKTNITFEKDVRKKLENIKDNISDLSIEINKTNNKLKSTYKNLLETVNLSSSDVFDSSSKQNLEPHSSSTSTTTKTSSTSFSDSSISISYNKLKKVFSDTSNLKKNLDLNAGNSKENFSDGEVPSLGEI